MKILIIWIGPWIDKGEAAMLISMAKALTEKIPNVSITAVASSFQPQEMDIIKYGKYDLKVLPGLFSSYYLILPKLEFLKFGVLKAMILLPLFLALMVKNIVWLLLYKSLRIDARFLIRSYASTVKEYRDTDWIIFCGGENLANVRSSFFIFLYDIILGKLLNKPVMLYAQSVGPFNQKYVRPLIKWGLNKVDLITTREAISKEVLDDLCITSPVFVTADAAFTLRPIPYKDAMTLLEQEKGIQKNELMIGVTAMLWHPIGQKGQVDDAFGNYIEAMAGAIDYVITKLNAHIIFFPQNNKISLSSGSDRIISMKIFNKIENRSKVVILTKDYTPEQLKGMYGCMSIFIGSRFHSCIFALSMNVPTIAIGYTHKASGIMKMLDLEEYVCDINTITTYDLTSKIDMIWADRDAVKKKLEENIRVMQAKSLENVRLAVEYLGLRGRT
jgi:colanic acid/amylovoran biosynthesis protein